MRGVRARPVRLEHLLGVAVVGGDEAEAAAGLGGRDHLRQAAVDRLDGGDGGRLADVAPTVLELLGVERPAAMRGESLLA